MFQPSTSAKGGGGKKKGQKKKQKSKTANQRKRKMAVYGNDLNTKLFQMMEKHREVCVNSLDDVCYFCKNDINGSTQVIDSVQLLKYH